MKKCVVLDLDNTLWGGIVGEDGPENLALSLSGPGAHFIAFQQALLDLYNRGIILAINSRNNPEDALQVIRTNPNMILKENHFAAQRINWNDKATNIRELAKELNIGLDSMVFLDDDETNRNIVRALVPEVETPELPKDPSDYTKFLLSLPYFEGGVVTDEDKMRGNYYVTERLRKEAEKAYTSKEDFLRGLKLEVKVRKNDTENTPRISQLTGKTNQFNVLKRPLTEEELSLYMNSPEHAVYHAGVTDTFGDYGITGVAITKKTPDAWHLESLLLSCRVLGRGVEESLVHAIQKDAEAAGVTKLTTVFKKSEKNMPAEEFVSKYFTPEEDRYALTGPLTPPDWITIHHG